MYNAKPLVIQYDIYISGEIGLAENYTEVFEVIRSATPNDVVRVHINSHGGDMLTALQFRRVLGECQGQVITSVEGECMSAATIIFLTADMQEVSPHSSVMFHHYSTIMGGKGGDLAKRIHHDMGWSRDIYEDVYEFLLSAEEIEDLIKGVDFYFTSEEILPRLEIRAEKLKAKLEAQDADDQDTMVEELLAKIEETKPKKKRTRGTKE